MMVGWLAILALTYFWNASAYNHKWAWISLLVILLPLIILNGIIFLLGGPFHLSGPLIIYAIISSIISESVPDKEESPPEKMKKIFDKEEYGYQALEESKEIITREIKLLIEKIAKDPNFGLEESYYIFTEENDENPKNFFNVATKNVAVDIFDVLSHHKIEIEEGSKVFESFFEEISDFVESQQENQSFNLFEGELEHFDNNKDIVEHFHRNFSDYRKKAYRAILAEKMKKIFDKGEYGYQALEESKEIITREIKLLIEKIAKDPNFGRADVETICSFNVAVKNVAVDIFDVLSHHKIEIEEGSEVFESFFEEISDFVESQQENQSFNLFEGESERFDNNKDILEHFHLIFIYYEKAYRAILKLKKRRELKL